MSAPINGLLNFLVERKCISDDGNRTALIRINSDLRFHQLGAYSQPDLCLPSSSYLH